MATQGDHGDLDLAALVFNQRFANGAGGLAGERFGEEAFDHGVQLGSIRPQAQAGGVTRAQDVGGIGRLATVVELKTGEAAMLGIEDVLQAAGGVLADQDVVLGHAGDGARPVLEQRDRRAHAEQYTDEQDHCPDEHMLAEGQLFRWGGHVGFDDLGVLDDLGGQVLGVGGLGRVGHGGEEVRSSTGVGNHLARS